MSLALDLHPFDRMMEYMLGHTRLAVENDGWAHCVLAANCRKPLSEDIEFESYHDDGARRTREDEKGPITWATAEELLKVTMITPDDNQPVVLLPGTAAALAYLKGMRPDSPVILYFH